MNSLFMAGLELQNFLQKKNWPFCFIGGLAVIRWGEMRMTQDIDFCLLAGFENEEIYVEGLLAGFKSRISDPLDFALKNRVLLLFASNEVPVDVSLSGLLFEKQMIERATPFPYAQDCSLITCSAEDLIVLKAFAGRPQDWMDVEGIIIRQGHNLDGSYIFQQLTPLCELKDAPEGVEKLKRIMDES